MSISSSTFTFHVENGVKHLDTRIVTDQTPVKRKRGRPPNIKPVEQVVSSSSSTSGHQLWDELQLQPEVNKRKRGRPPKIKPVEQVVSSSSSNGQQYYDELQQMKLKINKKNRRGRQRNSNTTSVIQEHYSDDDEEESVKASDTESVMNKEPVESVDNLLWHLLQKVCKDYGINLTWYLPEYNRRLRLDMEREIRRLARLAHDSELPDHGSIQEGMFRYNPDLRRMVEILYPPHTESECVVIEDRGKPVVVGWTNNPRYMEQTFILRCARDYEPDLAGFVAEADAADAADNDDNDDYGNA